MLNKLLLILLVFFGFSSCYKDFDLEGDRPPCRLVLHSFICADSLVMAQVSASWFVLDENDRDKNVAETKVRLYINDEFREDLRYDRRDFDVNKGYFWFGSEGVRPKSGDKIRLEASLDGYQPVSGETCIPVGTEIKEVKVVRVKKQYGYKLQVYITIKNDPGTKNDYALKIVRREEEKWGNESYYNLRNMELDCSEEKLLSQNRNILDDLFQSDYRMEGAMYPFSNDLITEQEYTLKVSFDINWPFWPEYENDPEGQRINHRYTIALIGLSDPYFRFLNSLIEQNIESFSSWGLAEPSFVYSNVSGGIGLVGGARVSTVQIDLRAALKENK